VFKEQHHICVGSLDNGGKTPRLLHLYENESDYSFARVRAADSHSLESEVGCKDVIAETISLYLPDIQYQLFNPALVSSLLML
jgi:hypothetical protein